MVSTCNLKELLAPQLHEMLSRLAEFAGQELFLVGGSVRDLLRGVVPRDIDLCCEGDSAVFESVVRARWKEILPAGPAVSLIRRSPKTELLKVRLWQDLVPGCNSFDIAPAEKLYREINPNFTRAELSSIEWNLAQRDFTVNAMAVGLGPREPGRLYDLFSGQADIAARCLRGLHEKLYLLDPVVTIRGPAAEARLGFALSAQDEHLIREAFLSHVLDSFNRPALYRYVKAALSEASAPRVARRLLELGGSGQVFPSSLASESLDALSRAFTEEVLVGLPALGSEGYAPYALAILAGKDLPLWKDFFRISSEEEHSLLQVRNLLIQKGLLGA